MSFDPNIRPFVTPDREAIGRWSNATSRRLISSRGARRISNGFIPGRELEESLAAWTKSGPRFCVATLGERGSLAMLGKERIEVPAPRVEVVDTVGAGDSFMSALLSAMDRDHALGAEAPAPSRTELERWLRFAATASAITCTRKGSDPPTRKEVEAALAAERKFAAETCLIRDEGDGALRASTERSKITAEQEWELTLWRRATLCLVRAARGRSRRISASIGAR